MELVDALMKLREERQKKLSESRRKYLLNRLLAELVELMQEKWDLLVLFGEFVAGRRF